MIEKLRSSADQGNIYGALLTDLSKAFDCLPHKLLIAKLHAYGFDKASLTLIYSYLNEREQRIKIDNTYSKWGKISYGVPQGSVLGPLLFNIFLCDLFMFLPETNIANYADDNTPYCTGKNVTEVLSNLEHISNVLLEWFPNNGMKANADKSHLLIKSDDICSMKVGNKEIINSQYEKLLGVKIDKDLGFNCHVESLCKKASQKLNALCRLAYSMTFHQRKLIMNSFILCHFSYCPLIWMFHSRKLNERINKIHERALRVVYKDYNSSFEELLLKDGSLTIHQRNLQKLVIEIFKVKCGLSPQILKEVFEIEEIPYNLRNVTKFKSHRIRTIKYGIETPSYIGPKLWNSLPCEYKELNSLKEFKMKIKNWIPINCPCKLCKTYISNVGYL